MFRAVQLVGLDHGVGGALDAAGHAQRLQQVAHQRGFACPQVAMQRHKGVGQCGLCRPVRSKGLRWRLRLPTPAQGRVQRFLQWGGDDQQHCKIKAQFRWRPSWSPWCRAWARELGFSQIGVAGVDLSSAEAGLLAWLSHGFHGDMGYMAQHGLKRARPAELVPGHSERDHHAHGLPAHGHEPTDGQDVELARLQRPGKRALCRSTPAGGTTTRCCATACKSWRTNCPPTWAALGYRVFTDSCPGAGGRAGRAQRPGLARQAHLAA